MRTHHSHLWVSITSQRGINSAMPPDKDCPFLSQHWMWTIKVRLALARHMSMLPFEALIARQFWLFGDGWGWGVIARGPSLSRLLDTHRQIQRRRKICGLGCVNHVFAKAHVPQPIPHTFLHICTCPACCLRCHVCVRLDTLIDHIIPMRRGRITVWFPFTDMSHKLKERLRDPAL